MTNAKDLIHSFNHTSDSEGNLSGLTKREYFAAMAMQAILSNSKMTENARDMAIKKGIQITDDAKELIEPFAHLAVDCADALIAELNKQP